MDGAASLDNSTLFIYTHDQFNSLRKATIATSTIALSASIVALGSFLYLWRMDPKRANRVSLRCVAVACAANGVDSIMNISMSFIQGPRSYCQAAGVISNVSRLTSASFLAVVGFNLVLIFVINVKRHDLLEYFYYPGASVYILVCAVVSVYKAVAEQNEQQHSFFSDSCWFSNYVVGRSYAVFSWMWYYGFLFFINIIAGIASGIALYWLARERGLLKSVGHRTHTGEASTIEAGSRFQRRQSAVLTKVVIRCIIYPLIPLLVNVFGFSIQLIITVNRMSPSYTLAMFDTVIACLEGFLVAVVFFTDPALTTFFYDRLQYWNRVYVTEYRLAEIRENDAAITEGNRKGKSRTLYIMPPSDSYYDSSSSWQSVIIYVNDTSKSSTMHCYRIPVRRTCISPSSLTQLALHYNIHRLSFCTLPDASNASDAGQWQERQHQTISSTTNLTGGYPLQPRFQDNMIQEVFIPYKSAFWARFWHRLLSSYCVTLSSPPSSPAAARPLSTMELRSYSHQTNPDNCDVFTRQAIQLQLHGSSITLDQTCHY